MCCEQAPMETLEDRNNICQKRLTPDLELADTAKKSVTVRSNLNSYTQRDLRCAGRANF